MSPEMIVCMEKRMADNCDTKVKFWREQIEDVKAPLLLLNETKEKQVLDIMHTYILIWDAKREKKVV